MGRSDSFAVLKCTKSRNICNKTCCFNYSGLYLRRLEASWYPGWRDKKLDNSNIGYKYHNRFTWTWESRTDQNISESSFIQSSLCSEMFPNWKRSRFHYESNPRSMLITRWRNSWARSLLFERNRKLIIWTYRTFFYINLLSYWHGSKKQLTQNWSVSLWILDKSCRWRVSTPWPIIIDF